MKTQSCGPTCFQANIVFYTFLLFSSSLAKLSESIPQASSCNTLSAYFCQHPYLKSVLGHHSSTQELDSICNQDNEIAFSISGLRFWESKGGSLLSLSSQPMVDGWYNTYPAIEPFFSCRQCNFKSPYKVDAQFSIEESHSIWQILALWVNNSINSELAPPKTDIWLRFGNRYDFDQSKQTFHPNTIIPPPVRSFSTFLWAPFFHKDYKTDIYIYDGECRLYDYD